MLTEFSRGGAIYFSFYSVIRISLQFQREGSLMQSPPGQRMPAYRGFQPGQCKIVKCQCSGPL